MAPKTVASPARGGIICLARASSATSFGSGGPAESPAAGVNKRRKSIVPLEKYEKDALQSIRDYLVEHRDQILVVKERLERGQFAAKKTNDQEAREKDTFDNSYMSFKQIPKYFFGDVLVSLCGLSVEQVDMINSKDRAAIRYMATSFFGIHDGDYLPRQCLHKATLSIFLFNRGAALGKRWEGWANKVVNGQGEIDWNKGAAYKLKWAGEGDSAKVQSVVHTATNKEAKVTSCNVTNNDSWEVLELYSDKKAIFRQKSGEVSVSLSSFFGADKNEFLSMMTKARMMQDAQAAEAEVQAKTAMFVKGGLATLATAAKEDQEKRLAARKRKAPNSTLSMSLQKK